MLMFNKKTIPGFTLGAGIALFCVMVVTPASALEMIVPIAGINSLDISLPDYVSRIYTWGIGLAALLAVLMIVIGGAEYIMAAGSFGEAEAGKNRIKSAVMGLILLLSISLILSIIGSRLTNISLDPVVLTGAGGSPASPQESVGLINTLQQEAPSYNLRDAATLSKISSNLATLERALATNSITPEQYTSAIKAVNVRVNSYFADQNLFGAIKKADQTYFESANIPYTQEDLNKWTEEKIQAMRAEAYGKIIRGLKDAKHPEILEQQKINARR